MKQASKQTGLFNTGQERAAGRERGVKEGNPVKLMLVRKEKINVTHHIDVTMFDLRRNRAPNSPWGHKLCMNHF
jgi:hypothetical protein